MNILFITAPSPPSQFHRIRALNLIKYLSQSHAIHLVSLTRQKNETGEELKPYCQTVQLVYQPLWRAAVHCIRSLSGRLPLEVAYCANSEMHRAVNAVLHKYPIDLIYVKRLRTAQFVPDKIAVPCLLDTTDAMSLYYERTKNHVPWYTTGLFHHEWRAYLGYEQRMLVQFPHWICCSPLDAAYLQRRAPAGTTCHIIPNGVDTEFYTFDSGTPPPHTLLFSGLMDKFVNVQAATYFVQDIFPKIIRAMSDVRLQIVGPRPTPAVRRLAAATITVTGVVPDLRTYIKNNSVVVCPVLTGTGTRNKILQAWSIGRPVVTTPTGLEGLNGIDGTHVLIAADIDTFAEKTILLLRDHALRQRLAANGRALVDTEYAMNVIIQKVNRLLEAIYAARSAGKT